MAKYNNVWPAFWSGDRTRWADEEKLLALYLLTCEHRNLEGYYRLPKGYVETDLNWTAEVVAERLASLETYGFCRYDDQARVVFVVNALEHLLTAKTDKQIKGAATAIAKVPDSALLPAFMEACERHVPALAKAIREAFGSLSDPFPRPPSDPPNGSPKGVALRAGAASASASTPDTDSAAARGHMRVKAEEITTTIAGLARKLRLPAPSVDEVEALLVEHEDRDSSAAVEELRRWCGRSSRPGNMLGAFGRTLGDAPKRPVSALPVQIHKAPTDGHRALWATAVEALQERAPLVFDSYLSGLTLVGVHGEGDDFVLSAPRHVVDWIASRHIPLLVDVLGRPVHLRPAAEGAAA